MYNSKSILKRFFASSSLYSNPKNPKSFFAISINDKPVGKLVFELYKDKNPKTAENFLALCKGDQKLTYKDSIFHRVINQFMAQGGDITNHNGTGGMSIYGRNFPDENMSVKHTQRGMLSMANSGPNTNGSQFFITFAPCPWLNGKHTVFGELVEGDAVLHQIEQLGTDRGTPRGKIVVTDCGEYTEEKKI
jgi:cyclophilin family peptidyl-prolyl cis-trans isomerase